MRKKIIEVYILFAIKNWFNDSLLDLDRLMSMWYNVIPMLDNWGNTNWKNEIETIADIITSKYFIEAIVKWLKIKEERINWKLMTLYKWQDIFTTSTHFKDEITKEQAIAIRDWKMEEYIISLPL